MAFELYGMLAGSVSSLTGEHIKPTYAGEEEAFLKKVVTPIYDTIAKVFFFYLLCFDQNCWVWGVYLIELCHFMVRRKLKEAKKEDLGTLSGETMMI